MDPRVSPVAEMFRLNTWLLHNCVDGFTEEQAQARMTGGTNSVAFTAAHLADARYRLLAWLGTPLDNPLAGALAGVRSIDEVRQMPSLTGIRQAWDAASAALARRLAELTVAELDGPAPQRFPAGGATLLGMLTFLAQHDSYHIGQLALLRKAAGLPAMKYTAPASPA